MIITNFFPNLCNRHTVESPCTTLPILEPIGMAVSIRNIATNAIKKVRLSIQGKKTLINRRYFSVFYASIFLLIAQHRSQKQSCNDHPTVYNISATSDIPAFIRSEEKNQIHNFASFGIAPE